MSAVIAFPERPSRKAQQAGTTGGAEVIIFPGVQVERLPLDLAECLPVLRSTASTQARSRDYDFY